MSDRNEKVTISKAKGRPMLTWVGKRPLTKVKAYPAQLIESFDTNASSVIAEEENSETWSDWPSVYPKGGLLFHGDNKDVLAHLLANGFRGKVKLIYIDPPFDSGADYVRKVQLRGVTGTTKVDGEVYALGEQIQYEDIWANDNYLQFMYERLLMLKELLAEQGAIALHCDDKKAHHLRILLDEIFGSENFRNEIIWHFPGRAMHNKRRINRKHNSIFLYAKSEQFELNEASEPWTRDEFIKTKKQAVYEDEDGREYIWQDESGGSSKGYKRYLDDVLDSGKALDDVWKISIETSSDKKRTNYPTQKPEKLIDKLFRALSSTGDIVLDCFVGSGTSAAVAQKLNRRWIGCDINKGAIQTTAKRLHKVMQEQVETLAGNKQGELAIDKKTETNPPQLSFTTWRVNDYDLAIQHNEAVRLACDHIGVTRSRADGYFDGTLGRSLVKIVPFNHPLTPLDLEDLRQELKRRPEEERDITLVALGVELKARAAIEEHNRNRPINKVHLIELRTDPKYGGFFKHEPLTISIDVKREDDTLTITINDVFSPSILQRLNLEKGVFRAQVVDWRAVVDCVLIDSNYDGEVFRVALSDTPTRKQDLVNGLYELPAPSTGATVAVKVIDMLGEEAVVTQSV